ncbi:MAG: alpha/beta fold hydrolase [Alphaproteobacteria bacterium]|jgi:polyhydroxyalkanoate synthase
MTEYLEQKIKQYGYSGQQAYIEHLQTFYKSLQDFLSYPYTPYSSEKKVLWHNGSTKLIDFGLPEKKYEKIILFLPSFINKSYILDLTKERSLLRYCANSNARPILLDWGNPDENEENYDFASYIDKKVKPALKYLHSLEKQIVICGYCLGGLVAIATAQIIPKNIIGLILLATPWDFSHFQEKSKAFEHSINLILSNNTKISSSYLRYFFYSLMPTSKMFDKFIEFSRNIDNKQKTELFVSVERWAMDDMIIANGVFKECANDFIKENKPMQNHWTINNQIIDLSKIKVKTLVAVPTRDVIVPHDSVTPLINLLPYKTLILPDSGHVGMIIGERAKKQLWEPMVAWLNLL